MIIKDKVLEYKFDKLSLEDGDLLIIKCNENFTEQQACIFEENLKKKTNKNIIPLFIPKDMEIENLPIEVLEKICRKRGLIND